MYRPFGRDIKDEMLKCIGYDETHVCRRGRFRFFKVESNLRVVRRRNKMWVMLTNCGYAEHLYTCENPATGYVYNAYKLTEKGLAWIGRQMGLRIIPPTVVEMQYKEKIC